MGLSCLSLGLQSLPGAPLYVVFVLDNGDHQQAIKKRAKDYVAALAADFRIPNVMFTLLIAAKEPEVLKETSDESDLTTGLVQSKIAENSSQEESADLNGGLTKAIQILEGSAGIRAVVVISDDDDDIAKQKLATLKSQLASSRVLLYSILLAQHDFFGSKTHSRRGVRLNQLSSFSGGGQNETDHFQPSLQFACAP